MAASLMPRNVGIMRNLFRQNQCIQGRLRDFVVRGLSSTSQSGGSKLIVDVKQNVQDQINRSGASSEKAYKISKAMRAYIEKMQMYEKTIQQEIAEYQIGKRHLARIMGEDPDSFQQADVDEAIDYLLPSGLFEKKARPQMKHPLDIFPKKKAAQFGDDGRPFDAFFYTGKPNYYHLLHDIVEKLEALNKYEDQLVGSGQLQPDPSKKLNLSKSEWISEAKLVDIILEPIQDYEYKKFIAVIDRLANHPYAYRDEVFISKFRKDLLPNIQKSQIPPAQVDASGVEFQKAVGRKKSAHADVTVQRGTGNVTINGQDILYFERVQHREQILFPLQMTDSIDKVDVDIQLKGGGPSGQAIAARFALATALRSFVSSQDVEKMRLAGLLTQDRRARERKKFGQEGARRRYTWKKR